MKIEEGKFYFLKDCFFEKMKDSNLSNNKDNGNKRPCYYCFRDKKKGELLWFIPISSKVDKYKEIYKEKLKRYKRVDTLVFGKVSGEERVFLIQNMFPTIEEYIEEVYVRKNNKVTVTNTLEREIKEKANLILEIVHRGKKVVFPDVIKMEGILLKELQ